MTSLVKGMIFLDYENKILMDVLTKKLGTKSNRPPEPIDVRLCDFDDVQYNLILTEKILQLSISYHAIKELGKFGAKAMLSEKYKIFSIINPAKAGFDITLEILVDNIKPAESEGIIVLLATLKRNLLGTPLEQSFEALMNGKTSLLGPMKIPYRKEETMYIQPQTDRIVIIFSLVFDDKQDQAIAKVFLQEFEDARRNINNAPPVSFSKDPPMEIRGMSDFTTSKERVGYLSFAIFKTHIDNEIRKNTAINLLQGFRSYLLYHIKASKSYLHSRMRIRVQLLLQVLNRAHPEKDPTKMAKKTISGKTFSRS